MFNFRSVSSLSSFTVIKKFFSFSSLSDIRMESSAYPRLEVLGSRTAKA